MKSFTLLETLLVIFILSFLSGLIILLILNLANYNVFFIFNIGGARDIDLTLNNMIKELRSMNQSNVGGYPIEEALPNRITFYADIDDDGLMERIRYFYENNSLKRGIVKPSGNPLNYDLTKEKIWIMVNNVKEFKISYYDSNYKGDEPPLNFPIDISKIRVIKVEVSIEAPNKGEIKSFIIATPRNLRGK